MGSLFSRLAVFMAGMFGRRPVAIQENATPASCELPVQTKSVVRRKYVQQEEEVVVTATNQLTNTKVDEEFKGGHFDPAPCQELNDASSSGADANTCEKETSSETQASTLEAEIDAEPVHNNTNPALAAEIGPGSAEKRAENNVLALKTEKIGLVSVDGTENDNFPAEADFLETPLSGANDESGATAGSFGETCRNNSSREAESKSTAPASNKPCTNSAHVSERAEPPYESKTTPFDTAAFVCRQSATFGNDNVSKAAEFNANSPPKCPKKVADPNAQANGMQNDSNSFGIGLCEKDNGFKKVVVTQPASPEKGVVTESFEVDLGSQNEILLKQGRAGSPEVSLGCGEKEHPRSEGLYRAVEDNKLNGVETSSLQNQGLFEVDLEGDDSSSKRGNFQEVSALSNGIPMKEIGDPDALRPQSAKHESQKPSPPLDNVLLNNIPKYLHTGTIRIEENGDRLKAVMREKQKLSDAEGLAAPPRGGIAEDRLEESGLRGDYVACIQDTTQISCMDTQCAVNGLAAPNEFTAEGSQSGHVPAGEMQKAALAGDLNSPASLVFGQGENPQPTLANGVDVDPRKPHLVGAVPSAPTAASAAPNATNGEFPPIGRGGESVAGEIAEQSGLPVVGSTRLDTEPSKAGSRHANAGGEKQCDGDKGDNVVGGIEKDDAVAVGTDKKQSRPPFSSAVRKVAWNGAAESVHVTGSWLDWTETLPLQLVDPDENRWEEDIDFSSAVNEGIVELKFIVDSVWLTSPDMPTVTNDFGSMNNVIYLDEK